ncbi:DUF4383 domain-containing protein [Amycolatopsis anabasis]|uniref:DUF4383 domain-containing protein n=1 Tax=Amycolatopsis anabasis TaxID=1840409 RepID=UPI00131E886E|nr:DUF4383 domain-containing protein [Amycolatopsis anabasis]
MDDDRRMLFARGLALLLGLIYLALGVAGFFFAEGEQVTTNPGDVQHPVRNPENMLWIFAVSPLLNVVHTAVGVLGLVASLHGSGTRIYGWVLFAGFAGLTAYGILAAATGTSADPVNLNWADVWLHGLTALAGLCMGFARWRTAVRS